MMSQQKLAQQNVPKDDLERFREMVPRDSVLQEQLRTPEDVNKFVALVLQLGRERGFDFTQDDVTAAMQASRRAWMERWIQ
jgi:predicted ribosomally synthesized peptide with nif11-like leader